VEQSIAHSLCFGVYYRGQQVGFARVVSDRAVFAYLMDVFVLPAHRGRGVGRALIRAVLAHPDLQGLRLFALRTRDAQGLYAQFGFGPLPEPTLMAIQAPETEDPSDAGAEAATNALGQPIGPPVASWDPPRSPPRESMCGRFCTVEVMDERFVTDLFAADTLDADGRTWTYLPYGPFATEQDYRGWLRATCQGPDPLFHVVIDSARGHAVGVAAYMRIQPASGSIEVGHVHFSPLLQRTPVATEAMYLMMRRAFQLGYRRYEWKCDSLNVPSRNAAQRLGFSFEGIFRHATVYIGRSRDTAWYSVIHREWPALAKAFEAWLAPDNFDHDGRQRMSLSKLTRPLLAARG
jgi:RimJ/RimL family protein N-acetyltransferase